MTPIKRRRASDRQPSRELMLQELCNRQEAELQRLRDENYRLRRVAQWVQDEPTRPAELTA